MQIRYEVNFEQIIDGGTRPHIEIVCSRQMWMQASTLGSLRDQKKGAFLNAPAENLNYRSLTPAFSHAAIVSLSQTLE